MIILTYGEDAVNLRLLLVDTGMNVWLGTSVCRHAGHISHGGIMVEGVVPRSCGAHCDVPIEAL